jgi:RNA-directed DNA polymerase
MKRIGYIYEKICDIENIKTAIRKSSAGKRNRRFVLEITTNIDYYAEKIQKLLLEKSYIPSPYKIKLIKDGSTQKERKIFKPIYYPDQIIHWALMLQLHKLFLKGMYAYTCGGVLGRGTSYGQKVLRKWIDKDKVNTKYCLKMDISKYYSSINKEILKQKIRNIIKDKDCLWLVDIIIDSCESGVPIGNYTSQWFSNYFLQELDYFIKCDLKAKYYVRYVDDLIIMGSNKKALHKIREKIEAIDFLGIRFYKNKTTLRKRNSLRIRRRMKKISLKEEMNYQDACAIVSYWGWIKRTDSYSFYNSFKNKRTNVKYAKRTISKYARKEIQINEL